MKIRTVLLLFFVLVSALPLSVQAQSFSDVTKTTYERNEIAEAIDRGWMKPMTSTSFGYGVAITPEEWLFILMFLRTSDACPEFGTSPNTYWTPENIRLCLAGAGVPVATTDPHRIRRDEAMQQLFALRRQSFAFQQLQAKPADYVNPADSATIPANRVGAMIAADRLKLLFRSNNKLLPASPLLREDAALSVSRFRSWEEQGGVDEETNAQTTIAKDVVLDRWRDLDTDLYVLRVKVGGDAVVRPILPRRSFTPVDPKTSKASVRDEFVYQPVSDLATESGALAAVNGSYFNVDWPWGALEDVAIVNGKTYQERPDRSTFIICKNGKMYVDRYTKKVLDAAGCVVESALGAGPLFLTKGEILTASTQEGFDEYTQWERRVGSNARTAVAVSADHKTAYLIVVAGKSYPAFGRGGASLGSFLKSKYPDIQDAMMLDGGGSSALYAGGKLLVASGVSGGTTQRSVVSALGVFSKAADSAGAKRFAKDKTIYWDSSPVEIKTVKPTKAFAWKSAKTDKASGVTITLSGTRGSKIQVADTKGKQMTFSMTFDRYATDTTSGLTLTRREGAHEKGWNIPTELTVINSKDGSATDVIKLFAYMPDAQKPDLKTFDVLQYGKTGIIFGDATGRAWYYYAKTKQLSPAIFKPPGKK